MVAANLRLRIGEVEAGDVADPPQSVPQGVRVYPQCDRRGRDVPEFVQPHPQGPLQFAGVVRVVGRATR